MALAPRQHSGATRQFRRALRRQRGIVITSTIT
jgi:hypothetical protein